MSKVLPWLVCGLVLMGCHPAGSGLRMKMSQQGLSSLQFGGWEYVNDGVFRVGRIDMRASDGGLLMADLHSTSRLDARRNEVKQSFAWGSVAVTYQVRGDRLELTITTANDSPNIIEDLFYEPLTLKFRSKPAEYDGNTPMLAVNMGDPTVLPLTSDRAQVVFCNDDVQKPLVTGFPWALNKPASTIFPLRVNTGRDKMYPDSLPAVRRAIKPGETDTYRLSLTFLRSSTSAPVVLPVHRTFVESFPPQLKWKDRRPIGQLILGRSGTGWRTNPRGWFIDQKLDTTTPSGVADFRTKLLDFADHSILYLQNLNAQGMVTWDIEGEEYAQPVSYIGDPRLMERLAPEMAGVADEYFAKFRKAGFRVGICIRPQTFTFKKTGVGAVQEASENAAQTLMEKIRYARDRWGATLFYVDSNGGPSYPLDVKVFQEVAQAFPDVLLVPEHFNTAYFSVTAPYLELRGGASSTSVSVLKLYSGAFSVINVTDGPLDTNYRMLETAVKRGDSLMARAWFADPTIDKVRAIYSYLP